MPRKKPARKIDGGGLRFNTGKDRWDLLPMDATEQVVKVLTRGAEKYAERNWERGMKWSICQGSLLRHMAKVSMGERNDQESGLPHMAHVACNALFLLSYELRGLGRLDDIEPLLRASRHRACARLLPVLLPDAARLNKQIEKLKAELAHYETEEEIEELLRP